MNDETAAAADEPGPADGDVWARQTAPQTPYSMRQVGIGLVFLLIGAVIAFGVPLVLS